jgi:endonuclease III
MPLMPMPPTPTKWMWVSLLRNMRRRRSLLLPPGHENVLQQARDRIRPSPPPHGPLRARLASRLGPWFVGNHRDLEWRHTRDPYAIWVSEIMLQQTRVDTVKAYWAPFMARFPTVAASPPPTSRTSSPRGAASATTAGPACSTQGARHVARALGGALPADPVALREIPGVGRYTAGAIASIAHDRPAALVDGNVARVFSRLLAITDPKLQDADAPPATGRSRSRSSRPARRGSSRRR